MCGYLVNAYSLSFCNFSGKKQSHDTIIILSSSLYFSSIVSQNQKNEESGRQSSSRIIHCSTFPKNQEIAQLTAFLHHKFSPLNNVFNSQSQSICFIISSLVFLQASASHFLFTLGQSAAI
jgi:hypothetical protein